MEPLNLQPSLPLQQVVEYPQQDYNLMEPCRPALLLPNQTQRERVRHGQFLSPVKPTNAYTRFGAVDIMSFGFPDIRARVVWR